MIYAALHPVKSAAASETAPVAAPLVEAAINLGVHPLVTANERVQEVSRRQPSVDKDDAQVRMPSQENCDLSVLPPSIDRYERVAVSEAPRDVIRVGASSRRCDSVANRPRVKAADSQSLGELRGQVLIEQEPCQEVAS